MVPHPCPPAAIRPHADADAVAPDDRAHADAPIFYIEATPKKVAPILRQSNSHRDGQIAWTPAQPMLRQRPRRRASPLHGAAAPPPHDIDAIQRIQRADEHGCRRTLCLRDDVHEGVDAVIEIDVRMSGSAIERGVSRRRSGRRMTGGVGFADIRFDFDDDAGRANAAAAVHEHGAKQVAGHVKRRAIVERASKHRHIFVARNRATARSAALATC